MTGRYMVLPPSFFGRVGFTYGVVEQMFGRAGDGTYNRTYVLWKRRRVRVCVGRCAAGAGAVESVTAAAAVMFKAARWSGALVAAGALLVAGRVSLATLGTYRNRAKTYGV